MTDRTPAWRAEPHCHYWYVDDFDLTARREQDFRTDVDAKRWLCSNYFRSNAVAELAASRVRGAIAAVQEATGAVA
jgi:hypothetical protein